MTTAYSLLDTSLISRLLKPMKWKICLRKQTDVHGIQDDLAVFGSALCDDNQDSVEDMWSTFEPRHDISNNMVCATSKGSDQPAHMRSLIRAFTSRWNIL